MTSNTFQRLQACLLMAASLHLALPVLAQSSALAQAPAVAAAATSPAPVWAEGEIRRVDREGQ